jgi:raffinose synthase
MDGVTRWMGLRRKNVYWMEPAFGKGPGSVPGETQFLLVEQQCGEALSYSLLVPLLSGDVRFSLAGAEGGVAIVPTEDIHSAKSGAIEMVFVGRSEDPFALVEFSMARIAEHLGTFRIRTAKETPEYIDHFGWCTWDAFYASVDAEKILEGFRSWKSRDFIPGLVIVDDGWLDRSGDYLNSFAPAATSFPEGFASLSSTLKSEFGLKLFGVWHAFQGYWGGLNPDGALGKRYRTIANRGKIRPWEGDQDKEIDLHLVDPQDAPQFYRDFYTNVIKVDGQSATEVFSKGVRGRVGAMKSLQEAFQKAATEAFGKNVLHCMSHSNDVVLHCQLTNAMRSSDDYRPLFDDPSQGQHIQDNAYNTLFIGQVAVPDWDMFQSHRAHADFHAAARALSGGPIYVSDHPGEQDTTVLEKLVWFDQGSARALRCPAPAQVSRDRLFVNCRKERKLLKITNLVNGIGLIGCFHINESTDPISDVFRPSDIRGLKGRRFAVWNQGNLGEASPDQEFALTLECCHATIATIAPLEDGFAVLGLLDKYNPPAGVAGFARGQKEIVFDTLDGGRVGAYSGEAPKAVMLDGKEVEFGFDSHLLLFQAPLRQRANVRIVLR